MNCTYCGWDNLIPINLESLMNVSGNVSMRNSESLHIYVCRNCGHLEFFDNGLNKKLAEEAEINKKYEQAVSGLVRDQEGSKNVESELQEKLVCVENRLKSLRLTIQQQQELTQEAEDLREKIKKFSMKVYNIEEEMKALQAKKAHELDQLRVKYKRYGQ